jgi:hypothetical protein
MSKISYARALAIAKQVKLNLASGGESSDSHLTAEDKDKLYKMKARKAGKTPVDIANELKFRRDLLSKIGF